MNTNRISIKKLVCIMLIVVSTIIGSFSAFAASGTRINTISYKGKKYYFNIPTDLTLNVGEKKKVPLKTYTKNKPFAYSVTWKSTDTSCFEVTKRPASPVKSTASGIYSEVTTATVQGKKAGRAFLIATIHVYDKANLKKEISSNSIFCTIKVNDASSKTVALKSISLDRTSATIIKGGSVHLSVKKNPVNATLKGSVTWTSSNTSVASVSSSGKVTAKKAGSATITAKLGGKSATCKVTVKAKAVSDPGTYPDASQAYSELNKFRTSAGVWYWNPDNKTKTTFNKAGKTTLKPLKRSATLEKVAKVRAKELATRYDHVRPNGTSCFTAYPSGLYAFGENIAMGGRSMSPAYVTVLWEENNDFYNRQGHRRNMLSTLFTDVGIACYELNGARYWVQCFGRS